MALKRTFCEHLEPLEESAVKHPQQQPAVCEECVKLEQDNWVHLRTCQECGAVLCCDSSPNQHATKHFHATGHAVVASAEAGPRERWLWCYTHEQVKPY